jgi:dimethylhistidine N-methyltransferase
MPNDSPRATAPRPTTAALAASPAPPATDARQRFRRDVIAGLQRPQKSIPCKYLYDARGSALFERICSLPEYYPTRTELAILDDHAADIAAAVGPGALVLEYGAGSGRKTERLLAALDDPAAYVPVDISAEMLARTAHRLRERFAGLEVRPLCADYTELQDLPAPGRPARRRVAFFPGSTIGNLDPDAARAFLRQIARQVGAGGALLVGADLRKDPRVLERAYDDRDGVTAAFNRNLLHRLRRELGARLEPDGFRHRAVYDRAAGRVEMHLESTVAQTITLGRHAFGFVAGETIHTENSHKFTVTDFADLARTGGWQPRHVWTDPARLFSVHLLTVPPTSG